jgi:hypothetical protein
MSSACCVMGGMLSIYELNEAPLFELAELWFDDKTNSLVARCPIFLNTGGKTYLSTRAGPRAQGFASFEMDIEAHFGIYGYMYIFGYSFIM